MKTDDLLLSADGLRLRPPVPQDYKAWAQERAHSRAHTEPWQPGWTKDELSEFAFKRRLKEYSRQLSFGTGYAFMVFLADQDTFIGMCILSDVRRGVLQSANMGYWIGEDFTQRGFGRAAVKLVLSFAFETLDLNRVEAATMPENTASRALLTSVGFAEEGLSRRFLKINGEWRDHLKFAILRDDEVR